MSMSRSSSKKRISHKRRVKSAKASVRFKGTREKPTFDHHTSSVNDTSVNDNNDDENETEENPVLMLQLKDMNDVIKIQSTFVSFEKMLKQRKRECMKEAKVALSSKQARENLENPKSKKKNKRNKRKTIYIDINYISNIIKSIGIIDENLSEKMYRLRQLEKDCLKTMEQMTILENKIEMYKEEFNKAKYSEYPRIASQINGIKNQLLQIKKYQTDLKDANQHLKSITNNDLNNIRALSKPHRLLIATIEACAIMSNNSDYKSIIDNNDDNNNDSNGLTASTPESRTSGNFSNDTHLNVVSPNKNKHHRTFSSAESMEAYQHWSQIRKLLKPQFINNLIKFDYKKINIDDKNKVLNQFFEAQYMEFGTDLELETDRLLKPEMNINNTSIASSVASDTDEVKDGLSDNGKNNNNSSYGSSSNKKKVLLTSKGVKKANKNVGGKLIDWLIATIKCHNLLPKGRLMNEKLNQLFVDLKQNESNSTKMEDAMLQMSKSVTNYQEKGKHRMKRVLKLKQQIDHSMAKRNTLNQSIE